jgi:hypothetical protein
MNAIIIDDVCEKCGMHLTGSWQGPVESCCERCNEPSGCIKGGESLDLLGDCQLLKNDYGAASNLLHCKMWEGRRVTRCW